MEISGLRGNFNLENGVEYQSTMKETESTDLTQKADIRTCRDAERSIIKKFRRELWCRFTKAVQEYELIRDGDRIAVCISGGKDSMLMAKLFQELYRHGKRNFELVFLVMNPGYNERNYQRILENARFLNVPITVFSSEIFDIVSSEESSPCYLCARMRRGYLYSKARELGCNKIALGHHYDDVIETVLMGMLYGGQIQTMMPKLHSVNFEGMELIRPMYLIREKDIIHWANYNGLRFIQCACRFTEKCASENGAEKSSKRAEIKQLIALLAERDPVIESNIFRSVENVNLNTIIAWKKDGARHHFLDDYDGNSGQSGETVDRMQSEKEIDSEKTESERESVAEEKTVSERESVAEEKTGSKKEPVAEKKGKGETEE
ncbi:MAG: tRNA 2-thiocytidine biosynthesis protein TtcA [Lachnospiraceae bacterium]|nr:tRNA 2-thiocytidine biosynthesis protein TtcA [Lachnospiraceae bacterium]